MNYCSRGRISWFGLHAKFRTKFEHQQTASFCGDIVVPATFSRKEERVVSGMLLSLELSSSASTVCGCCCPSCTWLKKWKKVLASAVGEIVVPLALKLSEYCKFSSVTWSQTGWVRWQVVVCCCIVVPVGFWVGKLQLSADSKCVYRVYCRRSLVIGFVELLSDGVLNG